MFRNVTFSYPRGDSKRAALSNVSFTIQPGQLVVIVGRNGSGKSTMIKLLSRLYDVGSGAITVDGLRIEEYRMEDLRKGIAVLAQDHNLFPLSIGENIRLGAAETTDHEKVMASKVMESMTLSGAKKIVENFSDGMNTVLEPVTAGYITSEARGDKELEEMFHSFQKPASSVSGGYIFTIQPFLGVLITTGGEKQRLVA